MSDARAPREQYPYEVRLPLAPYQFIWSAEPAVRCQARHTGMFSEELYTYADGSVLIIRNYTADGSFHLMSDRGQITLVDNAANPSARDAITIVRLP